MKRALLRTLLVAAAIGATTIAGQAQTASTSTTNKTFEVVAVSGNSLVVRLPEGTRELTVADDFRFTVDGRQLAARELKPGMKGTATITTRTTVTPVTVTEIKNGTVALQTGGSIIVRTDDGIRSFTQGDVDKRGVRIIRNGQVAQVADFRQGDSLTATIVTTLPPKVVTEQEVQATLAKAASTAAPARNAPAAAATTASNAPAPARTLPKTARSWPLLLVASTTLIAIGFGLTLRRRMVI
jgi:hypothetical protein